MRSLLVLTIVILGSAWALRRPYIGLLLWTWISIMNPHRMAYGLAYAFPVAAIIGGSTLIGFVLTKDKRVFEFPAPIIALILFMVWMTVTFPFSFNVEGSADMLSRVLKIDLMILVATILLHTKQQIMALTWVLVFSIGYFGVKGGIFTILTGGNAKVWGPEGSYIGGNNEVALAIIMIVPLMYFLYSQAEKNWQRLAWIGAMGLSVISAIGTQSRGALLGVGAMLMVLWWRGKNKMLFGTLVILGGVILFDFMPDAWHQRMDTINTYEQDGSAMGRINAWHMAWNLAVHNFFGGGFDIYNPQNFRLYAPNPYDVHAAHSIYFMVLGEHGFIGLFLFLIMWLLTWRWASWLRSHASKDNETKWAAMLGGMCQVSLVGYAVAGAFLSLSYFDLPYNLLVLVVLARRWVENHRTNTLTQSNSS